MDRNVALADHGTKVWKSLFKSIFLDIDFSCWIKARAAEKNHICDYVKVFAVKAADVLNAVRGDIWSHAKTLFFIFRSRLWRYGKNRSSRSSREAFLRFCELFFHFNFTLPFILSNWLYQRMKLLTIMKKSNICVLMLGQTHKNRVPYRHRYSFPFSTP